MLRGELLFLSKELQKLRDLKKIIEYYVFSSFRERTERGDWPKLALQKCEKLESDSKPYL